MSDESKTTIENMCHVLRDLFADTYRDVGDQEMRMMMSRAYDHVKYRYVGISSSKGFPYVTYPRDPKAWETGRVMTRFGRWYKGEVHPEAADHAVGKLTDLMTARAHMKGLVMDDTVAVTLLTGPDISNAYYRSVGGHSCMVGSAAFDTWFYAVNPETVALAVTSNGKARALLWTLIDGRKALDRIYPNSGFSSVFLANWALEQGYLVREHNSAEHSAQFKDRNGKLHNGLIASFLRYAPQGRFPYFDTFCSFAMPGYRRLIGTGGCRNYIDPVTKLKIEWRTGIDAYHTASREHVGPAIPPGVLTSTYVQGSMTFEQVLAGPPKPADNTDALKCWMCEAEVPEGSGYAVANSQGSLAYTCESCYDRHYGACDRCGTTCLLDDMIYVYNRDASVCQTCAEAVTWICDSCGERFDDDEPCDNGLCESCCNNEED